MALSQSALLEVLDARRPHPMSSPRAAGDLAAAHRYRGDRVHRDPTSAPLPGVAQRSVTRSKPITTAAGDLDLSITKLRTGVVLSVAAGTPSPDRPGAVSVVIAFVTGTSVRKVGDLVKALGADTGISKSEVSRICADLDGQVAAFADRDLSEVAFPYVFLDATYCKARVFRPLTKPLRGAACGP